MADFANACATGARDYIELLKAHDRSDREGVDRNLLQISESRQVVRREVCCATPTDLDAYSLACLTGARDLIELFKARNRGDESGEHRNLRQIINSLEVIAEDNDTCGEDECCPRTR